MELVELHELCAGKPDDAHECKSETKFAGDLCDTHTEAAKISEE